MVIGMGDDPSLGEYERLLLSMKTTARKELVLLHPDRAVTPGSTREWLKVRAARLVVSGADGGRGRRAARGCTRTCTWSCR